MKVKGDAQGIERALTSICENIESIVETYSKHYGEYGWDNFTETLANVAAQLYMMRMMIHNAEKVESRYR